MPDQDTASVIVGQQDGNHPPSKDSFTSLEETHPNSHILPIGHVSVCSPHSDLEDGRPSTAKLMSTHHSTRGFLPTPVPQDILEEALELAQHAPSNSNVQPWRLHILTGAALKRLSARLTTVAKSGAIPTTPSIPDSFKHYRSALGHKLYGPEGYNIPRSDAEAVLVARLRNYSFFDAPLGAIVSMDKRLGQADALSVGIYLQSLCLLLAERGLATCMIVSAIEYPEVVREELRLDEGSALLTGLAVGYEDEERTVNQFRTERDAWRECVTFHSE
jgi:nitroreductase